MNEPEVTTRPERPDERLLDEWFQKQMLASPDNLEAAARLIVGLITGLLAALLGVLSLAKDKPAFLEPIAIQCVALAALGGLLAALWFGLAVVFPQRTENRPGRPDLQRKAFENLVRRKSRRLIVAVISFGAALSALAFVLSTALFA
jgi:hypothetical protein